uniref:NADH-ubiquinone oxidoreductase chain 1 n=1 Tax=Microcotyle sebastis TaxID=116890 RepID=A3QRI2_MICSE|nr:NADH dehydrogenase subunit 1 [Microcotyle sebastis]
MLSLFNLFTFLVYVIVTVIFFVLVAFFVLLERKILGVCQARLGPQKVSFLGILQSFADFIKLLAKLGVSFGSYKGLKYRGLFYWLGVIYFLLGATTFISFFILGNVSSWVVSNYTCWLIVFSSLSGYGFIMCGWGSNSKYSLYGAIRASFSSISFEGVLMCIVLSVGLYYGCYSFSVINNYEGSLSIGALTLYICSVIGVMSECNRSPFDFSESESDLVSGFNTDYYGASFAILFASEYSIMIFFSWFLGYFFMGSLLGLGFFFFHSFILIFVRACFPRFRYDYYVNFVWKNLFIVYFLLLFVLL